MNPRLRPIAAIAVAVLSALIGWYVFSRVHHHDTLTLYGNVDIRQVDLAFAIDGPIAQVLVDEGAAVTAGQILARLDDASYRHSAAQADANAAQAQAALARALNGNRIEDIDAARANTAEARAQLVNAQAVLERQRALVKAGVTSQQSVENAERDTRTAQATLNARSAAQQAMEKGLRVEDIDAARAGADAAVAAAKLAHYRLDQCVLTAPAPGTIVTRVREPGAMAGPSAPVLSLALDRPVWVRSYVPGPELGRVAPGTKVTITGDDPQGKAYTGTIGFVSPTAEFTPKSVETPDLRTDLVYRLRIVVDDADQRLRQGMPVTVAVGPPRS